MEREDSYPAVLEGYWFTKLDAPMTVL